MKKLFLAFMMMMLITLPDVVAVSTEIVYDYTAYNGQGYNLVTGGYEERGYWASTNKMLINPAADPARIEIETAGYFHHILFFNDQNQYIGYKNCNTTTTYDTGGDEYLGTVSCAASPVLVTYPENARTFTLQVYQWREYLDDILLTGAASYFDIFGDDIFDTTYSDNLIENGDFSDGLVGIYYYTPTDSFGIVENIDDRLHIVSLDGTNKYVEYNVMINSNQYYISFDFDWISGSGVATEGFTSNINSIVSDQNISEIRTSTQTYLVIKRYNTTEFYIDNLMLFDLTTIYGAGNEPDLATFETVIDDWQAEMDGLNEEYYSSALNWMSIDLSERITYEYDYIEQTYNVGNGINNLLTDIGINTTVEKTFLGIAFLVVLVILVAMVSRSKTAIIVSVVIGYLAFTILGWFPVWIAILIALILLVLAIITFNSNGGGTNE